MLEGTNVSEGRGTNRPFDLVGAPWAVPDTVVRQVNGLALPGVYFRPALFEPTFHKHMNTACGGCQIHVLDRATFRPVLTGVAVIDAFRRAGPDAFQWREPPYEYEYTKPPIDILYGSAALRDGLERGTAPVDLARGWEDDVSRFQTLREKFLLY